MRITSPSEDQEGSTRYGRHWPAGTNDLTVELGAFLLGIPVEEGGLGKEQHFINVVDVLWNTEGSRMRFDWHPWALRMLEYSCKYDYLAVAGCASSGKSDFYALWAIVNYLADPENTKVLVTSTTLKDSKLRIWGRICEYWNAVPGLPGNLVDSMGVIRYVNPETGKTMDTSGITLLAGEKKKEQDSIGKMIGFKRRRVILVADELPELSRAILEAARANLSSNPYFQLIGIGNPNSRFDAFGIFAKPKYGWNSVTALDEEWETEDGYCIRFDGEKSPNVIAEKILYPYLLSREKLEEQKAKLGENSLSYWRMYRGYWCPTGSASGIYSEAEIALHEADERNVYWKEVPTRVAFLDTAFSSDGDRAMVVMGKCGLDTRDRKVLLYDPEEYLLAEDVTKDEPLDYQIAQQYKDLCLKAGVTIENAGIDSTGGGGPFGSILSKVWGVGFHKCYFGGAPSDRAVSSSDSRTGKEAYSNKVSEIWYAGVELIRTGQLKGMTTSIVREACARVYTTRKKGDYEIIEVEPKKKMKGRAGMSPDVADAAFGLLDLCRERLELTSVEGEQLEVAPDKSWDRFCAEGNRMNHHQELTSSAEDDFFGESNFGFLSMS